MQCRAPMATLATSSSTRLGLDYLEKSGLNSVGKLSWLGVGLFNLAQHCWGIRAIQFGSVILWEVSVTVFGD